MKQGSKKGFTLAEVLITLGIIGVVAALTIPTLIKNYQKTQYISSLQKAYTNASQALKQLSQDNGCVDDMVCTGLMGAGTNQSTFGTAFVKYFKVAKDCQTATNLDCWAPVTDRGYDGGSGTTYFLGGPSFGYYTFNSADGMSFAIQNLVNNCTSSWSTGRTGHMSKTCGQIIIDTNGPLKGPNFLGRDTFSFWITNGKGLILYPRGGADDNYSGDHWWKSGYCSGADKNGWYCAGRIVEENWQMTY